MQRPLQVKFAGQTVDPSEYKLFIGMLPRDCTEEQVREYDDGGDDVIDACDIDYIYLFVYFVMCIDNEIS